MKTVQEYMRDLVGLMSGGTVTDDFGTALSYTVGSAGSKTAPVPQGINPALVIKALPGRLARIVVTSGGVVSPISLYDNASAASGTVLFTVPANAATGTTYDVQMPAANGITAAAQTATTPALLVSYS